MAKKVKAIIKLQVKGGAANPSPPVGPALGQHGVNIMEFCKAFNAQTQTPEDKANHFLLKLRYLKIEVLLLSSKLHQLLI